MSLDNLVGKELGDYIIEEKVGDGAFLTVFRARHRQIKRPVAVKVLNDPSQRDRLMRESDVLSELGSHQNVVELYDMDRCADNPYIVVEFCDNSIQKELEQKKLKKGGLDWREATKYTIQMLEALGHIHSKGRVHGDIKPSNVLLSNGEVKLSDFNTRTDNVNYAESMMQSVSLAREGRIPRFTEGSVLYFTREHREGQTLTPKSDIHQVGQILYEMLTGVKHINQEGKASRHSEKKNKTPIWLDDVIEKATNNNPEKRYGSAEEMREELKRGLEGRLGEKVEESRVSLLSRLGKSALKGLKYAGKTITAPVWGPIWLIGKAVEHDGEHPDDIPGRSIFSVLFALGYYIGGSLLTLNTIENHFEGRTRAVTKSQFKAANPNLHLAYLRDTISDNKIRYDILRLTPINNLLDEDTTFRELHLSIPAERLLGVIDDNFFYQGTETRSDGKKAIGYPQVYNLDIKTNEIKPVINYDNENNKWLAGKSIGEKYLVDRIEGERVYPVISVDNILYALKEGSLVRPSKIFSLNSALTRLPNTNIKFERSEGGNIQFYREGDFWGDVELFEGARPMIVEYDPNK